MIAWLLLSPGLSAAYQPAVRALFQPQAACWEMPIYRPVSTRVRPSRRSAHEDALPALSVFTGKPM